MGWKNADVCWFWLLFYVLSVQFMGSNEQTLNIMLDLNMTSWKTRRNQQKKLLWMRRDACYCPSDNCYFYVWLKGHALCSCDITKAKLWKQTSLLSFLLRTQISFRPHLWWVKVFLHSKHRFAVQTPSARPQRSNSPDWLFFQMPRGYRLLVRRVILHMTALTSVPVWISAAPPGQESLESLQ